MQNAFRLVATATIVVCVSMTVHALDVPLTYVKHVEEPRETQAGGYASVKPSLEPPADGWKLPELQGNDPLYLLVPLGDSKHLMAIDRGRANDTFYSRLHFDANGNKDLSDDPAIRGEVQADESFAMVGFRAIDATIQVDGKALPFAFSLQVYCFNRDQMKRDGLTKEDVATFFDARLSTECMYRGEFELGGAKYRVMLGDSNCSGRFDERVSLDEKRHNQLLLPEGDEVFLAFGDEPFQDWTYCVLGDWLVLGGALYEVEVSTPEGKLTLTPSDIACAPLAMSMETEAITLSAKDGAHGLMMYRPGRETKAPAGAYRLLSYAARRQDAKGSLWMLRAQGALETPALEVKDGGANAAAFGEPFTPWVEVPQWSRDNFASGGMSDVQLSLNIEGSAKEYVNGLSRISGDASEIPLSAARNDRPKEPVYKVVKPDGEVAAQGNFEYG